MNVVRRHAATALAAACAGVLAAACGTAAPAARTPAVRAAAPAVSLNTSLATATGTWAVAVMGGPAARHDNFWQVLTRPAGTTLWRLVTPPGTADNGGLILAAAGRALVTAFRPSQFLTYTPLIQTTDDGTAWTSLSPLGGSLADHPAALATQPGGGLLALLANGTAATAASSSGNWRTLTSQRALAATAAGRRCGLTALTAAAFTSAGTPLLAGTCTRPGTAGIFTIAKGTWQPAGPAMPAGLARRDITVLSLAVAGPQTAVLLAAGTGPATSLLAAWSPDGGSHWTLSPPLALHHSVAISTSFGPGGTAVITLTGSHGEVVSPGHPWQALPALPPGTVTLAPGPTGGAVDALAARRSTLTIWQAKPGAAVWTRTQAIHVPIQFGSSG